MVVNYVGRILDFTDHTSSGKMNYGLGSAYKKGSLDRSHETPLCILAETISKSKDC